MAYVDRTGLVILQLMISSLTLDSALQICPVRYISCLMRIGISCRYEYRNEAQQKNFAEQ